MEEEKKDEHYSTMQLQFSNQSGQVASFFFSKGSSAPSVLAPYQSSDPIAARKDNAIYAHTSAGAWVIEPDQEKGLLMLCKLASSNHDDDDNECLTNKEVIKQVLASQAKDVLFIVNPQGQAGMFLRAAKAPDSFSKLVASIEPGAVIFVRPCGDAELRSSIEHSELRQLLVKVDEQYREIMEPLKDKNGRVPGRKEYLEGLEPDVKQQLLMVEEQAKQIRDKLSAIQKRAVEISLSIAKRLGASALLSKMGFSAVYVDPAYDITEAVLEQINSEYMEAKSQAME